MLRTFKYKPGTLVQVVEHGADKYDYLTAGYGGLINLVYPQRKKVVKKVWSYKVPGMIVGMILRYGGDPYPDYRVLVGEEYFIAPTRYLKTLDFGII